MPKKQRRGHGEGSIYKREDGVWTAAVDLGRGSDGKRKRKVIYGRTRAEVREKLTPLLAELQSTGIIADPGRLTVGQFLDRWLGAIRPPMVELRTWVGYEQHVRLHLKPGLGHLPLGKVTALQLQELYQQLMAAGLKPRTVRHTHTIMHTALQAAVDWKLMNYNPAGAAGTPRVAPYEATVLDVDQARKLRGALDTNRLGPLIYMAIMTGLRQGELLGLRWPDIDWTEQDAVVTQTVWYPGRIGAETLGIPFGEPQFKPWPKNRKQRRAQLSVSLMPILRRHQERQLFERRQAGSDWHDHNLVFPREDGRPERSQPPNRALKAILKSLGLPDIRFHDLRHTCASVMIALGTPLKDVSGILGHSTIAITADLYGHLLPGAERRATNQLDAALSDPPAPKKKRSQG